MKKKYLIFILFLISSCTNTIEKFYSGLSPQESITLFGDNKNQIPTIRKIKNGEEIYNMSANGYVIIGYSDFNATDIDEDEILSFGKKINAEIITVSYQYTHTINSVTPIIIPNFSDTNTTISNNYGFNIANIESNTMSYSTQYMQSSTRRYDYHINFWRKDPIKPRLGVKVTHLTQQDRLKIQSNKGCLVVVVSNGSPAYKNDILPNDIIIKVNNKDIYNVKDFNDYLQKFNGNSIKLEIFRNNKIINKTIKLD